MEFIDGPNARCWAKSLLKQANLHVVGGDNQDILELHPAAGLSAFSGFVAFAKLRDELCEFGGFFFAALGIGLVLDWDEEKPRIPEALLGFATEDDPPVLGMRHRIKASFVDRL